MQAIKKNSLDILENVNNVCKYFQNSSRIYKIDFQMSYINTALEKLVFWKIQSSFSLIQEDINLLLQKQAIFSVQEIPKNLFQQYT